MDNVPKPVNSEERYLHAMTVRLDALCHMVNTLVEQQAKNSGVAVEKNVIEDKIEEIDDKCQAKTRSGNQCRNVAKEGSAFCAIHDKG